MKSAVIGELWQAYQPAKHFRYLQIEPPQLTLRYVDWLHASWVNVRKFLQHSKKEVGGYKSNERCVMVRWKNKSRELTLAIKRPRLSIFIFNQAVATFFCLSPLFFLELCPRRSGGLEKLVLS